MTSDENMEAETLLSKEEIARRLKAIKRIFEIGDRLKVNATHEEIKAWITAGRH
jgi:hypothetical protein